MADPHEFMEHKLNQYCKQFPERSHKFISTLGDDLRNSTEIDGWQIVKEAGSGTAGEVRCGDLVLASRPREVSENERKAKHKKTNAAIAATERAYFNDINQAGGSGRYLQPLTPGELARDRDLPANPKN